MALELEAAIYMIRTRGGWESHFLCVPNYPKGATLPARCPAGGFPFSATFGFNDGSTAGAANTVACSR
jgi:hypothetical protein